MRLASSFLLCVFLVAGTLGAQTFAEQPEYKGRSKSWWLSVGALIGSSMLDAHSSWGRQELNPVLRGAGGEFGAKGLALKAGIATGVAVAQYFLLRKNPEAEKAMMIANFGMAGVFGGVAVYNHSNKSAPGFPPVQPVALPNYLAAQPASALSPATPGQ